MTVQYSWLSASFIASSLSLSCALAADPIDPEADKILRAMSSYLDGMTRFSVNLDIDNEIIDTTGRKLQFSASSSLIAKRPTKLHVHRRDPIANVRFIYDGKQMTVHEKGLNVYAQLDIPGNIGDAVSRLRADTGLDIPAGDLFYPDPYASLMDGVLSGDYLGTAYVNGVETHHMAFRQARVDWQLWVQTGDRPLPMKYIITSKWVTGAPQYSARFQDWETKPEIAAEQFEFTPPSGAKKLEEIMANEMGELILEGDQ